MNSNSTPFDHNRANQSFPEFASDRYILFSVLNFKISNVMIMIPPVSWSAVLHSTAAAITSSSNSFSSFNEMISMSFPSEDIFIASAWLRLIMVEICCSKDWLIDFKERKSTRKAGHFSVPNLTEINLFLRSQTRNHEPRALSSLIMVDTYLLDTYISRDK